MSESLTPEEFWEQRYAGSDRVWSGRVNSVLAEVVTHLSPGKALDLGCGESGDVVWLAARGWHVTGVDLSPTAIERARNAAHAHGIDPQRLDLIAANLETWTTDDHFDLVSASFLHALSVPLRREEILSHAATLVAPGGSLLIVSHAAPPPWASPEHAHHHVFPTPESDLVALKLNPNEWDVVTAQLRERDAIGPDGSQASLVDGIVHVRRREAVLS